MNDLHFNGLNSSGIATGKYLNLIGQNRIKETLVREFSSNRVSSGNKESIIINMFGDWGLGKSHLAYKLFSEINGLNPANKNELVAQEFSEESVCILLNYKFIESFQLKFFPANIAVAASYWLDDDSYISNIGSSTQICFPSQREKIINNSEKSKLELYNNQYSFRDNEYNSFEALKIFLDENNKKRLIIIIDEIEELEHKSIGFIRIDTAKLYERLTTFISTASDALDERYRIGFVFLISQEMYDKVKEFVEVSETSSTRNIVNAHLKRYSTDDMLNFLKLRLTPEELSFIKDYEDFFLAIWEATNRNFGWFEVAAKNLCLELFQKQNKDLSEIAEALIKTKKTKFSVFNQYAYKTLKSKYEQLGESIDSFCLKTFPHQINSKSELLDDILVKCGEVLLKTDENGDIIDDKFNERLKRNESRQGISEMISFENSIGSIPIDSIIDSLYSNKEEENDLYLTYFPDNDYQFHLTWAANRKLDSLFTEKLKKSLDMQEATNWYLLSSSIRKDIYYYYRPNISPNWINLSKLRMLREFLDSN